MLEETVEVCIAVLNFLPSILTEKLLLATFSNKEIILFACADVIPLLLPPELTLGDTTTLSPAAVTAVAPY